MLWVGHVARIEKMRNTYKILIEKPEGKILLGRHRCTRGWEDNIRTELRDIDWEHVDWIHLDQNGNQWRAVRYTVMNLRLP